MRPQAASPLPLIDWRRPWLAPYRETGLRLSEALQAGCDVAQALNAELARRPGLHGPLISLPAGPLCFVPQGALPEGTAYEAHIAATAQVPTRHNLHDLFNGLVWLHFPRLKARLNALQAAELAQRGVGVTRGPVRDALTLFDENAAWLQAPPALAEALARRDWRALFITQRSAWAQASLTLFGHALLEKLCAPRKGITAHVWLVPPGLGPGPGDAAALSGEVQDAPSWLCATLTPAHLVARQHHPLPVLGVPGWWAANDTPQFYEDTTVFRPPQLPIIGHLPTE